MGGNIKSQSLFLFFRLFVIYSGDFELFFFIFWFVRLLFI
jgi:hypothetical protein